MNLGIQWSEQGERVVLFAAVLAAVLYIARQCWLGWKYIRTFAQRLEKVMDNVETQLYPDHGTSLRDAVDRIQAHLGIPDTPPEGR